MMTRGEVRRLPCSKGYQAHRVKGRAQEGVKRGRGGAPGVRGQTKGPAEGQAQRATEDDNIYAIFSTGS